jgi:hypothetical protein
MDEADQHGDARDPTRSFERLGARAAQIEVDRLLLDDDHLGHRRPQRGYGSARGFRRHAAQRHVCLVSDRDGLGDRDVVPDVARLGAGPHGHRQDRMSGQLITVTRWTIGSRQISTAARLRQTG